MKRLRNYIDGKFSNSENIKWISSYNPANGLEICKIEKSNLDDVNNAVKSAKEALPEWSSKSFKERSDWLLKIANNLDSRIEEIAILESMDTGKPITIAKEVDAKRSVLNFEFFAGIISDLQKQEFVMKDATNIVVRKPVGVGALITPWNLPLYLLSWKVAPAIGMGNTVVCKPSELTPMTADLLMRVIDEVNLPPGVVNLIHGDGSSGSELVSHNEIDLVSFTGGTLTGEKVALSAAKSFKKISLELGGKNSSIVFSDCDLEKALEDVVRAGFLNQGQICLCGSRILIEDSIYENFKNRLVERVEQLKIGDPSDESTEIGSLISVDHRKKVLSYVDLAIEEGGEIITGLQYENPTGFEGGNWMKPVIIEGLSVNSRCSTEEIFGPIVTIHSFSSEQEVISIANNTDYGLAGSIWSSDIEKAQRVAKSINSGMIWINTWLHRDLRVPFGGVKKSGVGREGGMWSLDFFSEPMNICIKHD
ncbi:MAG: 2-hydroxymuconic semialdehyde dehydrogenase [Euryarchaeota archaeon]|nr:2-hydroxymuconic semialdehyde dehydrogenase [Euryarchaeota archaeon]